MDLRKALAMFRLKGRVPMEELNTSFRNLVKKYHPDKVRDYPEWAHERMAEINNAYETLAEWIAAPPREEIRANDVDESIRNRAAPGAAPFPGEEDFQNETPQFTSRIEEIFYPPFNSFLDALGLYYQYGLERTPNREEGVRRFRFREALRSAEISRDALERVSSRYNHPALKAAYRFARLSVADMMLGDPQFSSVSTSIKQFDSRLRKARRDFDSAVREILFPELLPSHMHGRAIASLYSCYTEFVLYLTIFTEGERRKTGILQTARYDSFMDLIELRNEGILRF